jgi:AcrR family transcriptional regulator
MEGESVAETQTVRRSPVQQRSRERVQRILAAATELIASQGSDALRMSEVADSAGISIGSLYQYFADKNALVRALAERFQVEGRACIEAGLAKASNIASFGDAFANLIDIYYGLFLAEPVWRDIWTAMQADRILREVELAESRLNGALVAGALLRLKPGADPQNLATKAFLVMQLGEATMRLAVSVPRPEGDLLVAAYKRMAITELLAD